MLKYLLIFLFLTFSANLLQGQEPTVQLKGRVLRAGGQPADGVTIRLSGSKAVAFTNADGYFSIKAAPGNYKATFSAIGMTDETLSVEVKPGQSLSLPDLTLKESSTALNDVVVTGQYEPQSLKNSVYMVKTISSQEIALRNPTKVQDVLATQTGFRFSNDLTLGTSDITMMGVSGQRVKILLDGVPLLDRGDTRESLNQIDINTIDHIETVDGPMSVSYGSDALGGVINLISKSAASGAGRTLNINGRVQEESAGRKYGAADGSGNHLANIGANWNNGKWQLSGGFTRNNFDGAQLGWMPKDQYLGNGVVGYRNGALHIWYRLDATNETLRNDGTPNINTNIETDAHYITHRWMHQLQGEWQAGNKLSLNAIASYTDYSRRTQTTTLNVLTGDRRLTLGAGEQDESIFDTKFFKATAQYKPFNQLSIQPGVEVNLTGSSGARILGTPTINDYAFFASAEWKPAAFISIRPGARFIKNSVYDAPPVIPSLNTRIGLSNDFDLRLSYARGFRSPALRELYFDFHDSSHSIDGNPNLKAEYSNSFNGTLGWMPKTGNIVKFRSYLGGFFNNFNNMITTGYNPADPSKYTYLNIEHAKTAGTTLDNTLYYKNLQAKLGFSYTGIYSRPTDAPTDAVVKYTWYPEVSSALLYHFKKLKGDVSLFYKFNGALPVYETVLVNNVTVVNLAKRSAFSLADFTLNKQVNRRLSLAGGIKNLFNITNVNNTSLNVGGAHSTGGPVPLGYGRSYFLGLNFQFATIQ